MTHCLNASNHARFAILRIRLIARFDDAVGENYQRIARTDRDFCAVIARSQSRRHNSEWRAAFGQAFNAAVRAPQHGSIVPGPYIGKRAMRSVKFGEEGRGESQSVETMGAGIAIERADEFV